MEVWQQREQFCCMELFADDHIAKARIAAFVSMQDEVTSASIMLLYVTYDSAQLHRNGHIDVQN